MSVREASQSKVRSSALYAIEPRSAGRSPAIATSGGRTRFSASYPGNPGVLGVNDW